MARKPSVRYYPSQGAFMATLRGKRHTLARGPDDSSTQGPTYSAACKRWGEIVANPDKPADTDDRIIALLERWLQHIARHKSKGYAAGAACYLSSGVKLWGALRAAEFRPHHVRDWLDSQTTWGSTTRSIAYSRLRAALRWNVDQGYLTVSPLANRKPPDGCQSLSRGHTFVYPAGLDRKSVV